MAGAARKEVRLLGSVFGLYASFLIWGYLQERLSSTDYRQTLDKAQQEKNSNPAKWTYIFVLNCCMAFTCFLTSLPFVYFNVGGKSGGLAPNTRLAMAGLSNTLASPFGYLSLRFINYPMLLLVKSSKLVPVMLLSYLLNGKRYSVTQVASVSLISLGVALFSCKVHPKTLIFGTDGGEDGDSEPLFKTLIGFTLVTINMLVDGFTNARQDRYRDAHPNISSFEMMYQMNLWQFLYMFSYLSLEYFMQSSNVVPYSQLKSAVDFMRKYPTVMQDVALFSLCGASGQVFIFYIITTFGNLVCVLVTVTRKFFSILLSVIVFRHSVQWWQWIGVSAVFSGLLANMGDKYLNKAKDTATQKKKSE